MSKRQQFIDELKDEFSESELKEYLEGFRDEFDESLANNFRAPYWNVQDWLVLAFVIFFGIPILFFVVGIFFTVWGKW
jgi:hypothetical protein